MKAFVLASAALIIVPLRSSAQEAVHLAVLPHHGVEIHRLFQTRTRVAMQSRDVETMVMDPPIFRESAQLGGMRQVVVTGVNGGPVIHLAFDSLLSRARQAGEAWQELRVGGLDTLWVQADIDEQMQVGGVRSEASNPGQALLIELARGLPGLALPLAAVSDGEVWTQDLDIPFGAFAIRLADGIDGGSVSARVSFQVDSLTPRERDTLAYVSFEGTFRDKVQPLDDGGVRRSGGGMLGSFVWSTGWRTIVAESARIQIRVAVHVDGTPGAPMRELGIVDTTVQTQVHDGT